MKIEELPLAAIKPYWRNPRINENSVTAVQQSIKDYGFNVPLVVDKELVILAGHTRYKALQLMNVETVPCVVVDLPPQKAKEFRIADNKTSDLGGWDFPKLILELKEIADLPAMQTYFPDLNVQEVVESLPNTVIQDVKDVDVQRTAELLASDYTTRNKEEMKGFIPFICPDCGYEYSVHINALEHMIKGIRKQQAFLDENNNDKDAKDAQTSDEPL